MQGQGSDDAVDFDVVVVGAGFAGIYMLYRLRQAGFTAVAFESADDVGGTWYWNRYPGARCDIQSLDYSFSFDLELDETWQWSEKYATQPEILRYLGHVVDKHDLRRDIRFSTRVEAASWDDGSSRWRVSTDTGDSVRCRWYVMATGCLSVPKDPEFEGLEQFGGEVYSTGRWPHEGVDFTGKRVGVIGTGSSGIQSIPLIAEQAAELTVFQRTPNFSVPAHNGPVPEDKRAKVEADREAYREAAKWSRGGVPNDPAELSALQVDADVRRQHFEEAYAKGGLFEILGPFNDLLVNPAANETISEFLRDKIRSIVDDPETAELLCPTGYPFGTKRPCLDTGYFETYNLPHVSLVDLRSTPLQGFTETGIRTTDAEFEFDAVVLATGFDAMTGAIVGVDIKGRDGVSLAECWQDGPQTYLGLTSVGFPNLFLITGPGSPSVLSNMMVSIEQHVDWVADCVEHMRSAGFDEIEPTPVAQAGWVQHVNDCADITLYPKANSWYMGANVPGKPRVFLPYVGGVDTYRRVCDDVVDQGFLGFELRGDDKVQRNDGVIRRLQPDVSMVLELMGELDLPGMDTMSADEARAFSEASNAARPPGPDVGSVDDGTFAGPAGDLRYRRYLPATPGPHQVIAYLHGGGWVLGSHDSDDPFCRDLCVQADAVVVSVDYRHAPESRFPAAVDDAFAGVRWVADNAERLGGDGQPIAVAGWSAGANLATVATHLARDAGGPTIAAQLLINPVTDSDFTRPSYVENADGYLLTAALMHWFWDHYTDPGQRDDPRVAPLKADSLSDLPPAVVVTGEFDPLRDEGEAYAEALASAGVPTTHLPCRGQIHTSITSVGMILSGASDRAAAIGALRSHIGAAVRA